MACVPLSRRAIFSNRLPQVIRLAGEPDSADTGCSAIGQRRAVRAIGVRVASLEIYELR